MNIEQINNAMREAETLANEIGEKFTAPRRLVFLSLLKSASPLKAYDILEFVSIASEKSTKPPTIYRALDFLCRLGLIHKIESDATYSVCSHKGHCSHKTHSPLFLICKNCGRVEEVHIHAIEELINNSAQKCEFEISRMVIETTGTCKNCRVKSD